MRAASSNQIYEHFQGNFSYSPICAANGSKTFIVSGGDVDFMRPCTEKTYGNRRSRWSSSGKLKFELRKPVLLERVEAGSGLERKRVDFLIRKLEV